MAKWQANRKRKKTWVNGDVYEGDWLNGKQTGKGKTTWANGDVYEGDWLNGKQTGKGKMTYASGSIHEGDYLNGNRTGKGKMTYASGNVYEGEWLSDYPSGKGKKTYANGDVYEGNWLNGYETGKGIKKVNNEFKHSGNFINNQLDGDVKIEINEVFTIDAVYEKGNCRKRYLDSTNIEFQDLPENYSGNIAAIQGNEVYIGEFKEGIFIEGRRFNPSNIGEIGEFELVENELFLKSGTKMTRTQELTGDFENGQFSEGIVTGRNSDGQDHFYVKDHDLNSWTGDVIKKDLVISCGSHSKAGDVFLPILIEGAKYTENELYEGIFDKLTGQLLVGSKTSDDLKYKYDLKIKNEDILIGEISLMGESANYGIYCRNTHKYLKYINKNEVLNEKNSVV